MSEPRINLNEWTKKIREEISYEKKFITEHKLFAAIILWTIFVVIAFTLRPPNKRITLLTAAEGTSYYHYGLKYRELLKQKGVDVSIIVTNGSAENARRLLDKNDDADAAFVMSGTIDPVQSSKIRSLGKLFYEPLWFFYKSKARDQNIETFTDFTGLVVNIGPLGSGTNLFTEKLLKSVGKYNPDYLDMSSTPEAINALIAGKIYGLITIDEPTTDNLKRLVGIPDIRLASFRRAEAYSDNIDYLNKIIVPMGTLDMARNFPPEDTSTVSTTTELLIKETMHPSNQLLLLETAQQVHANKSTFTKAGEFPSIKGEQYIQASDEAKLFYRGDKPFLVEYLPYWIAEGISRIIFYLIPIGIVSYPIIKEAWNYTVRRGRFKLEVIYTQLRQIESQARKLTHENERSYLNEKLDFLEDEALRIRIPKTIYSEYYFLRRHIDYVRKIINNK